MKKILAFIAVLTICTFSNSYGLAGGAGFEFEELIPRDEFNPKNLGTVKGKVQDILTVPKTNGIGNTIVAVFNSKKKDEKVYVVLGPDWYLKNQNFELEKGMYLIIRGSKIDSPENLVIIATEITYKDKTIMLRNKKTGTPEWKEWRRGEELFYKNYNW